MKWPLGNCGTTYLKDVTDTVQTVQYSDSQCTVHVYTAALEIFTTTQLITFDLSIVVVVNFLLCHHGKYTIGFSSGQYMFYGAYIYLYFLGWCQSENLALVKVDLWFDNNLCESNYYCKTMPTF